METYEKHVIAFLDILGFKTLINKTEFEQIKDIFQKIISDKDAGIAFYRANNGEDEYENYNYELKHAKIHIMSDSIIVAAPDEYPQALAVVIDLCYAIQEGLYECESPVFLRGAIACGDFYLDKNIIFGKGLVDAYMAQENYAIYPRIIVSKDVQMGRIASLDNKNVLARDREDKYDYLNILYTYISSDEVSWDRMEHSVKYMKIKNCIQNNLNGYTDYRVREKYIWLEKELDRIQRQKALEEGSLIVDY